MSQRPEINIEFYWDREGHSPFREWYLSLDSIVADRIDARLTRIMAGNLGDHKSLKGGIHELRFFFGPGYRIYFAKDGGKVVILLAGGTKGTQPKDIRTARNYYRDYLERKNETDV